VKVKFYHKIKCQNLRLKKSQIH